MEKLEAGVFRTRRFGNYNMYEYSNTTPAWLLTLNGKVTVHAINSCGGEEVHLHPFKTSAIDGRDRLHALATVISPMVVM
jgi:hypothetical protein